MTSKSTKAWASAESELPENARPYLRQMRDDYTAAARLHVPGFTGGPSPKILAELIRRGWRKEE